MKIKLVILMILFANLLNAQSYKYSHYCLDSLSSKDFAGRGYSENGDKKAANFIVRELQNSRVKLLGKEGKQEFDLTINNIHTLELKLHNKDSIKKVGEDFLVLGSSPTKKITLEKEKLLVINKEKDYKKELADYSSKVILFNQKTTNLSKIYAFIRDLEKSYVTPKLVIIQGYDKIQYAIGKNQIHFPVLQLKGEELSNKIDYLELNIGSFLDEKYTSQNIWAMVEGTKYKDSLYVFTAHYDHLGKVGKDCYFPGANDNASGVSVLLDLAKYYAQNPADYSIAFIFTTGEEIGLLGSKYAAENPLIDLSKVKFLFNMDMCGTGSGGIVLINGKKEINASIQIQTINNDKRYFKEIRVGGESCNSDHCPFVQKGVPAFFIFTFGCEYNEYHTIYDNGKDLSFTKHLDLCNILKDFINTYNR
ncbi:MAG: M28 family peptidase [Bacteroidales bacterium]|nr:M28 family peptidase [Bacteroidales bacterium]